MSFARDKLYNGYIRRNLPTIASRVKVREIMSHLACLTSHDRENIEAKRETYGNHDSMLLLLDCLKRRENWPEQFIEALEACEQTTLAAEIREEYDRLRGTNNSNPNSPPTMFIRAHVHPAPSASPLSGPESVANSQAAVAPPAEASAPPEPAAQASPPLEIPAQPEAAQSSAEPEVPEAVSPPEPPESAPRPSTPPPSPAAPNTQVTATPPPQREVVSHQEPVENSESDTQDASGEDGVIDDQVCAGNGEVSINSVASPPPDTPSPDPPQPTAASTELSPPRSPSPTQINSDVTDGSSFLTLTPERLPVQDTTPPVDIKPAAAVEPKETSEAPATQVVESSPPTEAAATSSPRPDAAEMDASPCDDSSVCLSKPGQLISIHPENHDSATAPASSLPYSGNSERLEMSEAAPDTVHLPACSAVSSTTVETTSALPCQENGIALNHNEPEENSYESPCPTLDTQVLENVVHVSEQPSILNLDGQISPPQPQIVNGEAAKEIVSAPPLSNNTVETVLSVTTPSSENHHPSEPAPADNAPEPLQGAEEKTAPHKTNTKYYLTAAGVGACALLMAWKFKKGI